MVWAMVEDERWAYFEPILKGQSVGFPDGLLRGVTAESWMITPFVV